MYTLGGNATERWGSTEISVSVYRVRKRERSPIEIATWCAPLRTLSVLKRSRQVAILLICVDPLKKCLHLRQTERNYEF